MPKKKRRRGPKRTGNHVRSGHHISARRAERDRPALLAQFVTWRAEYVPENLAEDEASHVQTLLELKADQLESPDPTFWTQELIEVLLTQVVPRKVIQPRELAMEQVPALGEYFGFLESAGRWNRKGLTVGEAQDALADLEFDVLEAADDPGRRSFSGNILTYAARQGVTLEDPDGIADFMEWYNTALTKEERQQLSDTGQLRHPSTPYAPGARGGAPTSGAGAGAGAPAPGSGSAFFPPAAGGADPFDEFDEGTIPDDDMAEWPWFLPDRDGQDLAGLERLREALGDPRALGALHHQIPLISRAASLLEFVGEGRQVTSTGALRRADVNTLVGDWGVDTGPRPVTTMWQIPELAGPWVALVTGGWITVTSTRVRPGAQGTVPYVPLDEDAEAFAEFGRSVISLLLLSLAMEDDEEMTLRGGPDTFAALMLAADPDGLDLPGFMTVPSGDRSIDELMRLRRTESDLERLVGYGLLDGRPAEDGHERHYEGNLALFLAVTSVIGILDDEFGSG
ncbi:hypothetical protein [Brachybacterium sp. GCM10030252]|uniref:hypothetical protein n=1 Tax=Brachybacterium sp. GCM10030252 TaxID=3273380 RepID=UPI003608D209